MVRIYEYSYDMGEASAKFEVDLDKFDKEMALATLDFFSWTWNDENDPIDEVMIKYAMQCIRIATFEELTTYGVIQEMNNREGFGPVDGSIGIKLVHAEGVELGEQLLELKE